MHIQEGYLPMEWCIVWYVLSIIAVVIGIIQLRRVISENPETKKFLTVNGIVMFALSLVSVPSLTGCNSAPAANALSGSLFGPAITSVVAAVVLLLQAFLLGYGGITTLGANVFAMGVVGPLAACIIYYCSNKIGLPSVVSLILAVIFANVFTIATTALQYFLASGESFVMFFAILAVSQVFMIVIDIIVSLVVFVVFKSMFKDSEIFSPELKDFFKIR